MRELPFGLSCLEPARPISATRGSDRTAQQPDQNFVPDEGREELRVVWLRHELDESRCGVDQVGSGWRDVRAAFSASAGSLCQPKASLAVTVRAARMLFVYDRASRVLLPLDHFDFPRCFQLATIVCHSNCRADNSDLCLGWSWLNCWRRSRPATGENISGDRAAGGLLVLAVYGAAGALNAVVIPCVPFPNAAIPLSERIAPPKST